MPTIRTLVFCALVLTATLVNAQTISAQTSARSDAALSGTWFGEFVRTGPDGKVSHDTAVLILEQQGVGITGSIGSTVDQQTAFTGGNINGDSIQFHLDVGGEMDFSLHLIAGHLQGSAAGKNTSAQINLRPAPGLLPHQQLAQEIMEADHRLFDAFSACDVTRYAGYLSKDLEFYQDHTGRTGYEQNLKSLQDRCAEGIKLRRELVEDSLVVNAVPGYGAIEAGTHRFYSRQADGSEHLDATAQFTNIWSKESGDWKLTCLISYNHH
jgi:ketosteroid isomerase-like protein